ncbi:MAG: GrpB family protein [Candidatus Kariarchaeaceae archaeon]
MTSIKKRSAPIEICEYDPNWILEYEKEKEYLSQIIGDKIECIEHVGSTSVLGLGAKPIIDILIGVNSLKIADLCVPILIKEGYRYVKKHEDVLPMRRYFTKGSKQGGRTHHIHMVEVTSDFFNSHISFRNYLRDHPTAAKEYYLLKKDLEKKYKFEREKYTNAKTDFVLSILEKAKGIE